MNNINRIGIAGTVALLMFGTAACGPSEKNARLAPTDLKKREATIEDVRDRLEELTKTSDASAVTKLLEHPDYRVRRAAAMKCAELKDATETLIAALAEVMNDNRREVRIAAIMGLSGIDADRAVDALIRALADSDAKVRMWAYKGIKKMEKRAVPNMIQHVMTRSSTAQLKYRTALNKTETLSDVLLSTLSEMGKSAVPYLVDLLKNPQGELTAKAVNVLGNIGPSAGDSMTTLLRLLDTTSDNALKKNTIDAIAKIGDMDPEVMPKLLELSEDEDQTVSGAAKQALKKLEEDI